MEMFTANEVRRILKLGRGTVYSRMKDGINLVRRHGGRYLQGVGLKA